MREEETRLIDRLAGLIAEYGDDETVRRLNVIANEVYADWEVDAQGYPSWKDFCRRYFHDRDEFPPEDDPEWKVVEKLFDESCEDWEKNSVPVLDMQKSDSELFNDFVKMIEEKRQPVF